MCRHSPDSHCDTDSTYRCRKFLGPSYVSLADVVSDTRGGDGDADVATGGGVSDTAGVASTISCLTLREVSWLGVSERERRFFTEI